MSDNQKFQRQYRISSARYPLHDYNNGAYFITICTKEKKHFFGEIRNGEMMLNKLGQYATDNLENIQQHYPYAEIPLYVVMPNHIHAIVIIDDIPAVETMCTSSLQQQRWKNVSVDEKMQHISHKKGRLSVVIGGFKRAITRYANQNNLPSAWQERFHDRVIRTQNECNRIADYIENNVPNWANDEYNS